jgi:prepilin-type N-terminal cleavage/methylation domain-containing protein
MQRSTRYSGRGFSVLELLVVIAIIALLMAALISLVGKLRERTRLGEAKKLIESLQNGLETYHLHFRGFPPAPVAAATGKTNGARNSDLLRYFLGTAFRKGANASKGEVEASINVGPLINFQERELRDLGGKICIVDPWGQEIHYSLEMKDDALSFKIPTPMLYSCGTNKLDDTADNVPANDDIVVGK